MAFLGYHAGVSPEEFGRLGHKFTRAYGRQVAKVWLEDLRIRAKISGG